MDAVIPMVCDLLAKDQKIIRMKKVVLIVFALMYGTLWAQDDVNSRDAKRRFVFGVKAGYNRSNVFDQKTLHFVSGPKSGGAGGVFVAIPVGGLLGIQPELLLSQRGFEGSGIIDNEVYDLRRTSTFIDLPVQLQLKLFSFFTMLGGIQYSYLVRQKDDFTFNNNGETILREFNNTNFRKNTAALVVGADINLWHFVISGRYGWDVVANHGDGSSSIPRYKNVWLQGTLGYRFY